jgi:hypothetical protein
MICFENEKTNVVLKQQNVYLCECVDELLFFREGQMIKAELCFFINGIRLLGWNIYFFYIQMVDYAYQEFWRQKKKIALPFSELIVQYAKSQSYSYSFLWFQNAASDCMLLFQGYWLTWSTRLMECTCCSSYEQIGNKQMFSFIEISAFKHQCTR